MIALKLNIFQKQKLKISCKQNTKANIYRIQANDSIMCGYFYFCIGYTDFMLKDKGLLILYQYTFNIVSVSVILFRRVNH